MERVKAGAIDDYGTVVQAYQQRLRNSIFGSCQEQLSPESQSLLLSRYDSQTPLEQVAQQIGKSVAVIKFQLFTIRKRLLLLLAQTARKENVSLCFSRV